MIYINYNKICYIYLNKYNKLLFSFWLAYLKYCFIWAVLTMTKSLRIYIHYILNIKYYWGILSSVSFFDDIIFGRVVPVRIS